MTPIRLGVAGLGRAFTVMLPTLSANPRVRMVAATDPRQEACRQFERDFGATIFASVEQLCADPGVDALYIATPHQLHAEHACLAAPVHAPAVPRAEVIDELVGAIVGGRPPVHSGEWARATTEVCLGLLASACEQRDIALRYQVGVAAG